MAPAGAVYITQAIRGALKTLEQSDDFFNFHSAQRDMGVRHACAPDRTWLAVGERLSDCRRDGTLRNLRESTAERMVHQGAHGVEFAEDGDVRDRQLATYEMLVGKSSIEYAHAKYLSKSHMSKLNDSVEQLRLLAATCNTSLHQPPQLTTTTPNIHAYTNSDCNNSQFDCSSSAVPMDEWHESMVKKTIQAVRNGQMSQQMKAMLLASLEISPT